MNPTLTLQLLAAPKFKSCCRCCASITLFSGLSKSIDTIDILRVSVSSDTQTRINKFRQ